MGYRFFNGKRTHTGYIQIDTKKCKACWQCIEECPDSVIGKINMPWHKHAVIDEADACTGCLKCVNVCKYESLSAINED